jgi:N-formylglutamate amidohydrolase
MMESPQALPAYRSYHGEIERHVAELRAAFPQGALLLDIHGQSQELQTTFRGTRGGSTVKALVQRHGAAAIQGEKSILGVLASRGLEVNPRVGAPSLEEDRRFAGGHTVHTYGSHRPQGIDAIQLEFGRSQRRRPSLADDLAEALAVFLTQYGYWPR